MTYVLSIRSNSANNVIEVNSKLFIEGQEYTPTNLAPVALSQGPTTYPTGTSTAASNAQGCAQLNLGRTYVRGSTGIAPELGAAGQFDTGKIACGQDVSVGFVWASDAVDYYGVAGNNTSYTISTFTQAFELLSAGSATLGSLIHQGTGADTRAGMVFCPIQNSRWITLCAASAFTAAGLGAGQNGFSIGNLTSTGTGTITTNVATRYPAMPYIGTDYVVVTGSGWSSVAGDANQAFSAYAANRNTGAVTTLSTAWLPVASVPAVNQALCFPSNAIVETPGSSVYFYVPTMSATALTVYVATVSNLASTPTINTPGTGVTLTLDTTSVDFVVSALSSVYRNVRAWTFSNSGTNYLAIAVYEPGATTTVSTSVQNLYLWRLDSKTTSTFLQKVQLGSAGRVRSLMPIDSTQKRIAVVYDDKIVFYGWNSSTNWTFQSTQSLITGDVGVDTQGRVWAVNSAATYISGGQSLYVYQGAGAASNIVATFQQSAYTYTGGSVSSNVVLNAYDTLGNRVALSVTLTRQTTNFDFSGNPSTVVTTSAVADTLVPISVTGTGLLQLVAAPT